MHSVAYLVSAHLIFDLRLSQAYLEKYSSISASTTFFNKRGRREHGFTTHEQWGLLPQSPCHYLLLLRPPITRGLPVGLCDHHHHHPSRDSPPSLPQTALGSSPLCPTPASTLMKGLGAMRLPNASTSLDILSPSTFRTTPSCGPQRSLWGRPP